MLRHQYRERNFYRHNYRSLRGDKPGYQYQLESVFAASKMGWSRETVGSHVICDNTVYDCGQNGIVGHLGCIFSRIYGNHIYNIALKREFYGQEIAGIKLHAAIDVQIEGNHIHDCTLGIWLDWQAQGTRVSRNLLHHNVYDLFVEVSHGPYLVDHNILASPRSLINHAQGGAYVHNLFAGSTSVKKMLNRAMPYHLPHSTEISGYAMVYGADDRFYQNLFIGAPGQEDVGTHMYAGCTASLEEYMEKVKEKEPGDLRIFEPVEQPAYIEGNAYLGDARAFALEQNRGEWPTFFAEATVEQRDDGVYLRCVLPEGFEKSRGKTYTTALLGRVRIVDADFENPDGSPLVLSSGYFAEAEQGGAVPGPIHMLKPGENCIKVW